MRKRNNLKNKKMNGAKIPGEKISMMKKCQ